jgi:hypothetical protein
MSRSEDQSDREEYPKIQRSLAYNLSEAERLVEKLATSEHSKFHRARIEQVKVKIKEARFWLGI